MTSGNVLRFPGAVNTIRTQMGAAADGSFEAYIRGRWKAVGGKGGMRGLCAATGITPEALYGWFRGDVEPRLGNLTALAGVLGVSRAEIVAAMDGYDLEAARREVIAREVEAAVAPLRALLRDAGLLQGATVLDEAAPGGRAPRARVA